MICVRFFVITTIIIPVFLAAQSGKVKYRVKIPNSSVNEIHDEPGYLYFDRTRSLFVYDRKQDKEPNAKSRFRDDYGQITYMDKNSNSCFFRVFFWMTPYISRESIPKIIWQLHSETKLIHNKLCKKATATFRGRTYTVWYTQAIPVSVGPWKLQGLPGLILEAKSDDGQVSFETERILFPCTIEETYFEEMKEKLSESGRISGKYVTFDEFKQARSIEAEKTEQFFRNFVFPAMEQLSKEKNMPLDTKEWKIVSNPKRELFAIELTFE